MKNENGSKIVEARVCVLYIVVTHLYKIMPPREIIFQLKKKKS